MSDPHHFSIYGDEPTRCGHCNHVGELDDFGGLSLPDGMVRCPRCGGVSETASGAPVDLDDMELQATDPID